MNHELLQSTFSDLASQTDYAATNYVHDPEHIQAECDAYDEFGSNICHRHSKVGNSIYHPHIRDNYQKLTSYLTDVAERFYSSDAPRIKELISEITEQCKPSSPTAPIT